MYKPCKMAYNVLTESLTHKDFPMNYSTKTEVGTLLLKLLDLKFSIKDDSTLSYDQFEKASALINQFEGDLLDLLTKQ